MSQKNTQKTLSSSLTIILVSTSICIILTIVAAVITGEMLYLVAAVLFAGSAAAGVWVVRKLQRTLGQ
jgi:predicted neutral ceramidase superfamily lipid hydrolase